jgi:leucyl-tRNA synthetase
MVGAAAIEGKPGVILVLSSQYGANTMEATKALAKAASKSDRDRQDVNKEKTGVFTGSYVINPLNGQPVPVWIADYVLWGYGTGAIMAVPAHDERDFEFARQFSLPVVAVVDPGDISGDEVYPPLRDAVPGTEYSVPSTVAADPKAKIGAPTPVGHPKSARDAVLGGIASYPEDGVSINSDRYNGLSTGDFKRRITADLTKAGLGREAVNYKLRDWLFSRQRYWGEPLPVLHLADGTTKLLPDDELPLLLPELDDWKPSGEFETPLSRVPGWIETTDPETGRPARRDPNTMPNWAGSCWYYLRFCDPRNREAPWSAEAERYWMPVDLYVGGVEHAVLHLLYARFLPNLWRVSALRRRVTAGPSRPTAPVNRRGSLVYRSLVIGNFGRAASHNAKCAPAE